eukprot:3733456-Ditylum_brightwellii.AAC.1
MQASHVDSKEGAAPPDRRRTRRSSACSATFTRVEEGWMGGTMVTFVVGAYFSRHTTNLLPLQCFDKVPFFLLMEAERAAVGVLRGST